MRGVGREWQHESARGLDARQCGKFPDLRGLGADEARRRGRQRHHVEQTGGDEIAFRPERLARPPCCPCGVGLGPVRALQAVVLGGDAQPHQLAFQLAKTVQVDRAAQRHIRRIAIAAQHGDVRQRRLQLAGDQRRHRRDLLRHLVHHHHVIRPHGGDVERSLDQAQVAIGHAQHHRLVLDRRVDRIARQARQSLAQLPDQADLRRRHGAEPQIPRHRESRRDVPVHPGQALPLQRIAGIEFERPVIAIQVAHDRTEHEAAVVALVLGNQEQVVVGVRIDEAQDEVVVGIPLRRVHEIGAAVVIEIDDELDGLGARDVVVSGPRTQRAPLLERVDARHRVRSPPARPPDQR